ncbi:hypothetical protein HMPREF0208_00172 [Citrobacter koseri]|nr:hypothetical protein HMPREF3220_00990 [Citrobacter koseri]KXA05958.1 hypothetical protein HMPREF3207_00588 [Citrobacter koseri]KXB47328.1 hypothetical protein HMPREF0208_00172 [Citrobacter koseri]BCL47660.1 hypothetical protein MPUCK001_14780 [Citrobacter koseri]BDG85483.1 hypothetical protein TUM13189_30430 [Citrobacter koseri]
MHGKQDNFNFCSSFLAPDENVTESNEICAVAHTLTFSLQKEIDNSRREK